MLLSFFFALREGGLKPSVTEFLALLDALKHRLGWFSLDEFYVLSRAILVKDEAKYDRFDQIFGAYWKGIEDVAGDLFTDIPEEWLRKQAELMLTDEEKAKIESMGGFEKLMEELKKRLEEQNERHEGGNKWVGTAGRSPFGAYGYNPEGVRIGQDKGRMRSAVKVWDKREFANLDDNRELGTRNIKLALRRLRKFARQGAEDTLDLPGTISGTAKQGGLLDIRMQPERRNTIKVLIFFDVGGSMDPHVKLCEELFSAAKSEFKHMEYYYFHNFLYESVWKDNRRRRSEKTPTNEVMRTFGEDYRVIFVGDATMSPYEIAYPGGSVEHWNEEAGEVWMRRLLGHFEKAAWLNPEPEAHWQYSPSVGLTQEIFENRMFPLTLDGLDRAMRKLAR
ncbi:VWA domain-containing protein [bacterium]|nr:VWA domain-containing protein [bacterium]